MRCRPLHKDVLLYPESREAASRRVSAILTVIDGDSALRDGYPEATCRAEVLAVGSEVTDVRPGDTVLIPSAKNAEDMAVSVDDKRCLVYPVTSVLAVLESP